MLVQMPRRDAAAHGIEDGDARLTQMADHGRRAAARRALPLEAHVVARVAVGHVHVAVRGVDDHVEEDGADVGEGLAIVRRARDGARRVLSGVDAKDVVVGQGEGNGIVPVAAERVDPVRAVEREDQAGLGAGHTIRVLVRRREAARVRDAVHGARPGAGATVADGPLVDRGRLVAGVKDGRVDGVAIAAHRERARRVAEEGDDRERRAAGRRARIRRVKRPDVGPADAGAGELGITRARHARDRRVRPLLPAVRARDEDACATQREHDVARLVADQQGPSDPRLAAGQIDDADAVRKMVHHPHLGVRPRRDRDGLEPDGHRVGRIGRQGPRHEGPIGGHVEDLETVVRRVDREEMRTVRRQRQRPHLTALELDERGRRAGSRRERDHDEPGREPTGASGHRSSPPGSRTVARVGP